MPSIIASNLPEKISQERVSDFFSFCGEITAVELLSATSARIVFKKPAAIETALLLNDAELEGNSIQVQQERSLDEKSTDNKVQSGPDASTEYDDSPPPSYPQDINQEAKPKTAILAQYLSNGYVLSDNLIGKAIEFDNKNGYSSKFKSFLGGLDSKYHIQERTTEADSKYKITDNIQQGKSVVDQYIDRAVSTPYGSKLHNFYKSIAKETQDVHEEAKRLAELKKGTSPSSSVPPSNPDNAI